MAKGKKGRQSNKKKKKGSNAARAGSVQDPSRSTSLSTADTAGASLPSSASLLQGRTPNFREYERRQAIKENYPTVYSRYKGATQRVVDYLREKTPDGLMAGEEKNKCSVDALILAVDWLVEQNHVLDPLILKDLKLAIRMRTSVAKSIFGGGDRGHKYFVQVLTYCWTNLILLPRADTESVADAKDEDAKENRFQELQDEDEDEIEDEEMFPSSPIPRPEPEEEPMTLGELMASDDRNDAILFLLTLNELMEGVAKQYVGVKNTLERNRRQGVPESATVEVLLEAAVATNMAIQQVQQMELEIQLQHIHLTTPYRLLSTLVMPEVTANIASIVREHASIRCTEKDIVVFLGDCIESYFRNPSDELGKRDSIVQEFCSRYKVNTNGSTEIERIYKALEQICVLEVPIGPENANAGRLAGVLQSVGAKVANMAGGEFLGLTADQIRNYTHPEPHSWIHNMAYIGKDRAIHHTIRLLQTFGSVIRQTPDNRQVVSKRGFFGSSPWRPGRSRKIHGDLDELLMSDILPQWVTMCRKGIWGRTKLPRENELCTLFVMLRDYVKNPGKAVSWSLAFAVHAMLTGILENDSITNQIIDVSKAVFGNYFDQLEWAGKAATEEREMVRNKTWGHNMVTIEFMRNLGLPVFGDSALWNPVCGGTIFSYLTLFCNLEGGCALIDCQAQLRITLYLYHGLLLNGIIREGDIPMLDMIYSSFKSSRAVWEGGLPRRGELVKKFWICFGMSPRDAKIMAENAKRCVQVPSANHMEVPDGVSFGRGRKMKSLDPSEIATCFRRICNRDFHDVQDKYHTPEQRLRMKGTDIYAHSVRVNDTLDAIESEQVLLSFNLSCCAVILEQLVCSLGRVLQWEPLLSSGSAILRDDKRQGFAILFSQHLLGALDFADDPMQSTFLDVPIGLAPASFMKQFFNRFVPPERVLWFQAIQEED